MEDLGIDILFVRGIIPPSFADLVVQAGIEGNIQLGNKAWLQSLYLEIRVTPPSVMLQGTVKVLGLLTKVVVVYKENLDLDNCER